MQAIACKRIGMGKGMHLLSVENHITVSCLPLSSPVSCGCEGLRLSLEGSKACSEGWPGLSTFKSELCKMSSACLPAGKVASSLVLGEEAPWSLAVGLAVN